MLNWHLVSLFFFSYYFFYSIARTLSINLFPRRMIHVFDLALIIVGFWILQIGTVRSFLVGGLLGLFYLPLMVGLTSPSLGYFIVFRYNVYEWIKKLYKHHELFLPILFRTLKEELVWRSAFVYLARINGLNDVVTLSLGSFLFYSIHWKKREKIVLLTEFELFCFSFFIYGVYLQFNSFMAVWFIHFIRNSYLTFFRTLSKNA